MSKSQILSCALSPVILSAAKDQWAVEYLCDKCIHRSGDPERSEGWQGWLDTVASTLCVFGTALPPP